jgi:hypothetical protein
MIVMEKKQDMRREISTKEVQELIYRRRLEERKWNKGLDFEEAVDQINNAVPE